MNIIMALVVWVGVATPFAHGSVSKLRICKFDRRNTECVRFSSDCQGTIESMGGSSKSISKFDCSILVRRFDIAMGVASPTPKSGEGLLPACSGYRLEKESKVVRVCAKSDPLLAKKLGEVWFSALMTWKKSD